MALYRANPDGRAPAGLSAGDEVLTNGGTYRITAVNADGSYQSVKIADADVRGGSYASGQTLAGLSPATGGALGALEAGFTPSERTQQAQSALNGALNARPGGYASRWDDELDALYRAISTREPFRYDLGRDTLYAQYREQYRNLGQLAMMDTMGRAAALTGGYGSSYSQAAGQQAYNGYLQKLNDLVPELYRTAREQYDAEGRRLTDRYALVRARDQDDYSRYRDSVSDYYRSLSDARSAEAQAYDRDYRQYADMLDYWLKKAGQENEEYWQQTKWTASRQKSSGSSGRGGRQTSSARKKTAAWTAAQAASGAGAGGSSGGAARALTR